MWLTGIPALPICMLGAAASVVALGQHPGDAMDRAPDCQGLGARRQGCSAARIRLVALLGQAGIAQLQLAGLERQELRLAVQAAAVADQPAACADDAVAGEEDRQRVAGDRGGDRADVVGVQPQLRGQLPVGGPLAAGIAPTALSTRRSNGPSGSSSGNSNPRRRPAKMVELTSRRGQLGTGGSGRAAANVEAQCGQPAGLRLEGEPAQRAWDREDRRAGRRLQAHCIP